jgi:hypothetical protein
VNDLQLEGVPLLGRGKFMLSELKELLARVRISGPLPGGNMDDPEINVAVKRRADAQAVLKSRLPCLE